MVLPLRVPMWTLPEICLDIHCPSLCGEMLCRVAAGLTKLPEEQLAFQPQLLPQNDPIVSNVSVGSTQEIRRSETCTFDFLIVAMSGPGC
jgi:hypothetical protein